MRIIFVKSVFCPNEKYFKETYDSLCNNIDFMKLYDIKNKKRHDIRIELVLIGWIKNIKDNLFEKLLNKFLSDIKLNNEFIANTQTIFFPINYGKYYMTNNIKSMDLHNYDVLLYLDHDIYFNLFDENTFDLFHIGKQVVNSEKIGMVALNHTVDVRHKIDAYQNKFKIHDHVLTYPDQNNKYTNNSIAIGAYIINPTILKQIDDLPILGIYGLDDVCFLQKINDIGYINCILYTIYIIHPYNTDISHEFYEEWKTKETFNIMGNKLSPITREKFYKKIQKSMNLWS